MRLRSRKSKIDAAELGLLFSVAGLVVAADLVARFDAVALVSALLSMLMMMMMLWPPRSLSLWLWRLPLWLVRRVIR